jgi:hypothetical protein
LGHCFICLVINHLGDVMVSLLDFSVVYVDCGIDFPIGSQPKTMKLVFVAFPLSKENYFSHVVMPNFERTISAKFDIF